MNGYHISTILGTLTADPKPICTIKSGEEPVGADLTIAINSSRFIDGKWVEQTRFITATAWYRTAKRVLEGKWCRKGYHIILAAKTTERTYPGKNGEPVKRLDYEILDAQPLLLSSDHKAQQKARATANVENERAPQDSAIYTAPHPTPSALSNLMEADEDIPF